MSRSRIFWSVVMGLVVGLTAANMGILFYGQILGILGGIFMGGVATAALLFEAGRDK